MLVGRFRKAHSVRLFAHGFAIRDDRVGDLQRDAGVVLLEVLETDLEVQLTSSSDDVLARLLNRTLYTSQSTYLSFLFTVYIMHGLLSEFEVNTANDFS